MTEVIYLELKEADTVTSTDPSEPASKYRVYLSPVDSIDDTYKNNLDVTPEEDYDNESGPTTNITNTKSIIHSLNINGALQVIDEDGDEDVPVTKLLPDQSSAQGMQDPTSKQGRLRILFGYGGIDIDKTSLVLYINGISYEGFMSRMSTYPTAGVVDVMDFIIEFTEGTAY